MTTIREQLLPIKHFKIKSFLEFDVYIFIFVYDVFISNRLKAIDIYHRLYLIFMGYSLRTVFN